MLNYIRGKSLRINNGQRRDVTGRVLPSLGAAACAASCLLIALSTWGYAHLRGSLPRLEGSVAAQTLSAPVTVARDTQGVPTLTGRTRADLASALGYLHAQERFFQMDGQRLQEADGKTERRLGDAVAVLSTPLAEFL